MNGYVSERERELSGWMRQRASNQGLPTTLTIEEQTQYAESHVRALASVAEMDAMIAAQKARPGAITIESCGETTISTQLGKTK